MGVHQETICNWMFFFTLGEFSSWNVMYSILSEDAWCWPLLSNLSPLLGVSKVDLNSFLHEFRWTTKVCLIYLPKLVLVAWSSPDQTRDKQWHRTTAYRKHRVKIDRPSVVMATCCKRIRWISYYGKPQKGTIRYLP